MPPIGNEISATDIGFNDKTINWYLHWKCKISEEIASVLILNAAQKQQVLDDPSQLTNIANILEDKVDDYKCN